MPSQVVRRNLKRKQAAQRRRTVGRRKGAAEKERIEVRLRRVATRKVIQKRNVPNRTSKVAGVVLAAFLAMNPSARKAFAGGHPAPPPSSVNQAGVKNSKVTIYAAQASGKPKTGFLKCRLSQKLTRGGPVIFFEQGRKSGKKPNAAQIGLAQRIKVKGDVLVKAGLLMPNIGKEEINFREADFGVILSKSVFNVGADHLGRSNASKFSGGVNVGGVNVDASYMQPDYFTKQGSARLGASSAERLLGINLKNLSTDLGIALPKGKHTQLDIGLFIPKQVRKVSGGIGASVWGLGTGKESFSGVLVIKF